MGVPERNVIGSGAPAGQLPRKADTRDAVGKEWLAPALKLLACLGSRAANAGPAAVQPAQESFPCLLVLPPQMNKPVVVPAEIYSIVRCQRGADRQEPTVKVSTIPRGIRETGREPSLVITGHDRLKRIRMSKMKHR